MDKLFDSCRTTKTMFHRIKNQYEVSAGMFGENSFTALFLKQLISGGTVRFTYSTTLESYYDCSAKYLFFDIPITLFNSKNYTENEIRYFLDHLNEFDSKYLCFDGIRIIETTTGQVSSGFMVMSEFNRKSMCHKHIYENHGENLFYTATNAMNYEKFLNTYPEWLKQGDTILLSIMANIPLYASIERTAELMGLDELIESFIYVDEQIQQRRTTLFKRTRPVKTTLPPKKKQKVD